MPTAPLVAVRRLALARFISVAGSLAAYVALVDLIYVETDGSPVYVSAAVVLTIGAVGLFGPLGGWIADRMDRKRALVWSDLAGAAAFAVMALVHEPGPLLFVALISAVVETPFRAGSVAAVPSLVGDEALITKANGVMGIGMNLGIMLGPAIGGLLVAWIGAGPVFIINAVSFVVSALLVVSIRGSFEGGDEDADEGDITTGFRILFGDRVLLVVTLAWMVLVLGVGLAIVADRPLAESFGTGSQGFGIMIAVWGSGSVLGAWLASKMTADQEPSVLVAGFVFAGLAGIGIWLSPVFWFVVACNFIWGMGDALSVVAEQGIIQRRTSDQVRARVVGANEGLVHVALVAGFLAAAPVIDALGAPATYAIGGVAALAAGGLALTVLRRARVPIHAG